LMGPPVPSSSSPTMTMLKVAGDVAAEERIGAPHPTYNPRCPVGRHKGIFIMAAW
jgi:hypothetical protein